MSKIELIAIREYILKKVGYLTLNEFVYYYELFMNGSDEYILGVEYKGKVYGFHTKDIPLEYCSTQTDHKKNIQYFRFGASIEKAKIIAESKGTECFGNTEDIYKLYKCNTKKGYNSGYCFEKAVFNSYGMADEWVQDNKASTKGGDITINGKEIQIKYAEKGSMATITSTATIIKQLDRLIKIAC